MPAAAQQFAMTRNPRPCGAKREVPPSRDLVRRQRGNRDRIPRHPIKAVESVVVGGEVVRVPLAGRVNVDQGLDREREGVHYIVDDGLCDLVSLPDG